jgi:hypothetical protein
MEAGPSGAGYRISPQTAWRCVGISSFVKLSFAGPEVLIEYVDETFTLWGQELWDANKGRLGGTKFIEYDGNQQ